MPYAVADVELTEELPEIGLGAGEDGLALLVRRRGRPIGFVLRERAAGGRVGPEELARMLADELGLDVLRAALAEELTDAPRTPAHGYTVVTEPGAMLEPGWEAALAEALAEQPDAAVVVGPSVPLTLEGAREVAVERAQPDRFRKRRLAPVAGSGPDLVTLRALAAAGAAAVRPELGAPARPADAVAAALRAGLPVAYEPALLVRTAGGRGRRGALRAARARGAAMAALLRALGEGTPPLRGLARRRTARWLARELRRAALAADARTIALAELAGAADGRRR